MSGFKVTYFDMKGRAESVRLVLAAAGVPFEDVRLKGEEWCTFKSSTPWGQVPILEFVEDGNPVVLAQTTTICRFLGKKFNLWANGELEAAKCDEYMDASNDLFEEWVKFMFIEQDEGKKTEMRAKFVATTAPTFLKKLESLKEANGGDFLVGKKMTWADINMADKLEVLEDTIDKGILKDFPHLKKLKDVVFADQKIKAHRDAHAQK